MLSALSAVSVRLNDTDAFTALLDSKSHPLIYDGIEPSSRMTLSQGLLKASHIKQLVASGFHYTIWVADWFAFVNNKLNADLKKIQTVAKYFTEVWKTLDIFNSDSVHIVIASEQINMRPSDYWLLVMDIARRFDLKRVLGCWSALGTDDVCVDVCVPADADVPANAAIAQGDEEKKDEAKDEAKDDAGALSLDVPSPHVLYPCMQCADPFFLQADICHVNALQLPVVQMSRDYCDIPEVERLRGLVKPLYAVQPSLMSLKGKASHGTDPEAVIYMDDEAADVKKKITRAFCAPGEVEDNPCLDYIEKLVLPLSGRFEVKRPPANGGDIEYVSMESLRADFATCALHPGDLKPSLVAALNALLEPVRAHFAAEPEAKAALAALRKLKLK